MAGTNEPLDELAIAIGRAVYWWGCIDVGLQELCLNVARFHDLSFTNPRAALVLQTALSHQDMRRRIATAKALAAGSLDPDLYGELCSLLNHIDGELRKERNRFVHDQWTLAEGRIVRRRHGAHAYRPQSRQLAVRQSVDEVFASPDSIHALARHVEAAFNRLAGFCQQLDTLFSDVWPPEEWPKGSDGE